MNKPNQDTLTRHFRRRYINSGYNNYNNTLNRQYDDVLNRLMVLPRGELHRINNIIQPPIYSNFRIQMLNLERNNNILNRILNMLDIPEDLEDVKVGLDQINKYYQEFKLDEDRECNICVNSFNKDDNMYKMICGHIFCLTCINRWFSENVKCPNCNQDLRDLLNGNKPEPKKLISELDRSELTISDDENNSDDNNIENDISTNIQNNNSLNDEYADMPPLEDINGNLIR